jgi:hypothetical protein
MNGRVPAVCSALRTHQFWKDNGLRLVEITGPKSGQSTTVVFTYEFVDQPEGREERLKSSWAQLRGAMKDILVEVGGGEAYLRSEREKFYGRGEGK